ncbi:MAG: 5-formyltetrahydrofolate cyclo-ligase [Actinomycetaceae bacterium]|nr:5-formyltetrahydrofolate cyclo-ligase [Arcanobacterium sp.]MDD7504869.1 5-formyltetrahydrofolate cyclo-ligase [Actinomycetaceae bacterium]MDY6142704.1 5-formyltetrahydrofolate cyclo-ligase [Arcanobacterium sp.]
MRNHPITFPNVEGIDCEDAKQLYRAAVREHRKERPESSREKLADLWIPLVRDFVKDCGRIACYVSVNYEPPTYALCEALAADGHDILLPKLGPGLQRSWGRFKGIDDLAQLAPGRPPEPSGEALSNDVLGSVDAMIVPGLLVSRFGERIGQGGGWYDRALKEVKPGAHIAAMVYPEEYVDFHLPADDMDVPVHYVITPFEVLETSL